MEPVPTGSGTVAGEAPAPCGLVVGAGADVAGEAGEAGGSDGADDDDAAGEAVVGDDAAGEADGTAATDVLAPGLGDAAADAATVGEAGAAAPVAIIAKTATRTPARRAKAPETCLPIGAQRSLPTHYARLTVWPVVFSSVTTRFEVLANTAPDVLAIRRGFDAGRPIEVRREVRRRAGAGSTTRIVEQLGGVADQLVAVVEALPDAALAMPGGEGAWNVAEALGHTADARVQLALAASLAAGGRWPANAPPVVPGIPGDPDAGREALLKRLATSQRIIERAARTISGHEAEPCPLEHPLVGRMRCGEWLLFAGVHDLMHLEQLEALEASLR